LNYLAILETIMIYEVTGDITLTKAQVIAHGVAANDPMNQGLAKTLHENFPTMHKAFHHWCHQHHPKPGEIWAWDVGGRRIVNLMTQEGGYKDVASGRANYSHVRHALHALAKMAVKEKFTSIALPRLATGAGGLNWEEVLPIIQHELGELDIPVYVYTFYCPKQRAAENLA
jgi:O-acetyl-ADP-ribose deacetylase (regulator of RNase III)